MKKILLLSLFLAVPVAAFSADLQIGDSEEQVMKELGFPDGNISLKNGDLWIFEEGKVLMVDGRVARIDFFSDEEMDFRKQDEKRSRKAHAAYEKERQKRIKEGLAVKKKQLANASFLSQSPESQLHYWKQFQQSYPGVDVSGRVRELNQEVMARRAARERVAQQTRPRIVRTSSSRVWCNYHGYSCRTRYTGYRCSSSVNRTTTTVKPGVTEYEDATFFTPTINTLPGGAVRGTVRPNPKKN